MKGIFADVLKVILESDWFELLKIILSPENWPTFSSELDGFQSIMNKFIDFSIYLISRCNNIHTNYLVKEV